jgi:low affinity Fe/Cu permease
MSVHEKKTRSGIFERFSGKVSKATGSTAAFIIALILVICWAITGPAFHYSETWQLVINTGTTIITFLMVFLIQKAQNKDSLAIQLKLNELIAATQFASNRLVNAENLTEDEMKVIQKYYSNFSQLTKADKDLQQAHSIEEAAEVHQIKKDLAEVKEKVEQQDAEGPDGPPALH